VQVEGGVVDTVSGAGGSFQVTTSEGLDAAARLVVLATGVADDPPALPGLARLWGRCVLHCVYCDGWEVRDQPFGVLVTKADDLYAASRLRHLSADLTVFAHGVELTGRHHEQLDALGIAAADGPIEELSPDGDGLVARTAGGARTALRALFVQAGVRPASGLAAQLGCRMSPSGLVLVDSFYRTSVPGIYAVGDMARPAQSRFKPMQVAVAAADGVTAGIAADQALAKGDLPFGYFADAGEQ
jgi:thioredoxin reductase